MACGGEHQAMWCCWAKFIKWNKCRVGSVCHTQYKHSSVNREPPQFPLEWICIVRPEGSTRPVPAISVSWFYLAIKLLLSFTVGLQSNAAELPFLLLGDFIAKCWYRLPKKQTMIISQITFPVVLGTVFITCSSTVHTKAHYTQFLFAFSIYYMWLLSSWSKVRSWGSQ